MIPSGRRRGLLSLCALAAVALVSANEADTFDHRFSTYAAVLAAHVRATGVDYQGLKENRAQLDEAVAALDSAAARQEPGWTRDERLAFWINAYNLLTLRAIVDRYPIRAGWFALPPRNSIRQIDGVWTRLRWQAAGQSLTLDDIEHRIIRPVFLDARIHFAVNCASVSCPPLAREPYVGDRIDAQLDEAARRFLASAEGVRVDGDTFRVTSLFKWYGDDFIAQYAPLVASGRPPRERAILGVLASYAPPPIADRARTGMGVIRFLDYDWSLNDVPVGRSAASSHEEVAPDSQDSRSKKLSTRGMSRGTSKRVSRVPGTGGRIAP
jgi:hypothetical protein